jgi:hypothetical protein
MAIKLRIIIFYKQDYLIPLAALYYFVLFRRANASEASVLSTFNGIEIVILYFE